MSSIFHTTDFLDIQMNNEDTSVANICDMSSILCANDVCEVTMNDTDTVLDVKQVSNI